MIELRSGHYTVQAVDARPEHGHTVIQLRPAQGFGLDSIRTANARGVRPGDVVFVMLAIKGTPTPEPA